MVETRASTHGPVGVWTGRDEDEIVAAAMAAYFRRFGSQARYPGNTSAVEEYDGRHYVILRNGEGPLAVYRWQNDDSLKLLRRLPTQMLADFEAACESTRCLVRP